MLHSSKPHLLANDLEHILTNTLSLWEALRNQQIFITGGTGFFGCWLLESFIWANRHLNLNANALVLTRDISRFSNQYPNLAAEPALTLYQGDVRNFAFPAETFSHIIHAATDTNILLDRATQIDTIVAGTQHTLEFAKTCAAQRILLISSGAVYGKQPAHTDYLTEDYLYTATANDIESAYTLGKRSAEALAIQFGAQHAIDITIARCFAFLGPYMPLNSHFAIGNFIRDGLQGGPIKVNGDGSAYRSYLYAADLMIWLWTILFRGATLRPYNVGSDVAISIAELAKTVASSFDPEPAVHIAKTMPSTSPPERYIPSVERAQSELNLSAKVSLMDAIQATKHWYTRSLTSLPY